MVMKISVAFITWLCGWFIVKSVKLRALAFILSVPYLVCYSTLLCSEGSSNLKNHSGLKKTIGISQIVQHPALDTVREGMLMSLREQGYIENDTLNVLYENAQGDASISAQIASKLISLGVDVGVAISTFSAQSLLYTAEKQGMKIPIVYTAVTDPIGAKLNSTTYPITGISDAPNLEGLLELIHVLLPKLKTLGLLYNPSEANSVSTVTQFKKLAEKHGIRTYEATVNKTVEVVQAMNSLIGKVDALYFPQDNTVVAAIDAVVKAANQSSLSGMLPIFTNDTALVKKGILAAVGYNYKDIGYVTGCVVSRILNGEDPKNIPPQSPAHLQAVINGEMAKKWSLKIPDSLQYSKLEIIY